MPHPLSLAYCTNIWDHHQAPICRELVRLLGEERFKMCLFEPVHEERRVLGWASAAPDHSWIVGPPTSNGDLQRLTQFICDADAAVLGDCPQAARVTRAATGKLTFIMSERLWKMPFYWWRRLNPRVVRAIKTYSRIANRPNVHYLPMGAYAAADVRSIGAYGDRMWVWAYFAEVASHPPQPRKEDMVRILWVGRMLDWKRVDLLLKAVARLGSASNLGQVQLVGAGPEEARLRKLAKKLGLDGKCIFRGPMPADQVRPLMRESDIYVFPSNRNEGWGVAANEAMSEGAVLVGNDQAGSAPILIIPGHTGFLFQDGNVAGLAHLLETLIADAGLRERVRQAAWAHMQRLWHPRVGAERLVGLCQGLLGRTPMPEYVEGPCSRADVCRMSTAFAAWTQSCSLCQTE